MNIDYSILKRWHQDKVSLLDAAKTQFGAKLKTQSLTIKCGKYKKEAPLLEKIYLKKLTP